MLAYISMHKNGWENHSYVALCSTADRAALQMLKDNPHLKTVYLCLDNDNAGLLGCKRVADSIHELGDYTVWRVVPQNKDWDEDLKALHGREAIPSDDATPSESTNNIDLTM
jgi:DNA primase